MMKKYIYFIPFILIFITLISFWIFPTATPWLGIASILFSLAIAIYTIFEKHKESENPRLKITKDILILLLTFLLIIFLGGITGLFVNYHVRQSFGPITGFLFAILASFTVGYLIKVGIKKLIR